MRRSATVLATGLLAVAAGLGAAPAQAADAPRPSLLACPDDCVTPAPTGRYAVGRMSLPIAAAETSGVTAWHPAIAGTGPSAELLPPELVALLEQMGVSGLEG